ncbi:hypothetical protein [Mycobacterium shigaense]|uniref:hypothetical protein n=1 Tax=Mycobacterium shigaense TaxID=722731 RepID=UPI000BBAE6FD|nr:hypothetical protein [Mycobacterium shigaense]PRI13291.1 hypothetical protein B2J96_21090 [Mycobacterium shigaense]
MVKRQLRRATAWLGLTPDPEQSLPELLARLEGGSALPEEQDRVTRLILRGTGRRWLRYLDRATQLALNAVDGRAGDPATALAVAQVVLHHDQMLIGLPGDAYRRTSDRRKLLAAAIPALEALADNRRRMS